MVSQIEFLNRTIAKVEREVAALLGRSEAAVSAHLSRGRKSLRQTLGGEFYEQRV